MTNTVLVAVEPDEFVETLTAQYEANAKIGEQITEASEMLTAIMKQEHINPEYSVMYSKIIKKLEGLGQMVGVMGEMTEDLIGVFMPTEED
jgi:hypothetical protein